MTVPSLPWNRLTRTDSFGPRRAGWHGRSLPTPRFTASTQGQALLEAALLLPLLLLLTLNAVNFGLFMFGWITVNNAARAAAEYQIYNGVAIGFPASPSFPQVQCNVWYQDVSSLPNKGIGNAANCTWSNVTIEICSNRNGTVNCNGTGTYAPPADPEPTQYTLYSVDVAYQYAPLFSAFSVPALNVFLTLPPTTIHQQVVMRSMQ